MMTSIGQYWLSVTAAGLIGCACKQLLPEKGTAAHMGRMLAGLFLVFTVISPLADVELGRWDWTLSDLRQQAEAAVIAGQENSKAALQHGIKQRTEAYIWDKAQKLEANLAVEVTLSDDTIPVPVSVRLSGNISPYAKRQLQDILETELGIPKEAQQWT